MRAVSEEFLDAVRGSHRMRTRATVLTDFQDGVSPTGVAVTVLDGEVVLDATANVRATLDVTLDGTRAWDDDVAGLLTPYGNEIYVERGIEISSGTSEWVGLGYFRMNSVEQDAVPDGPIRVSGVDRMAGIIDARLVTTRQFTAGTDVREIFDDLVGEVYPDAQIEYDFSLGTYTLGSTQVTEEDRYAFLNDLATSRGKTWYWDHRGILKVCDPPDDTVPVWEVNSGERGVLIKATRELNREGVYNAVVVTGETVDPNPPVRAVAYDSDGNSPTYYYGRFGKVPRFYTSSFITTNQQARDAARAMLRRTIGLPHNVNFSSIVNPALEPYDPVEIRIPREGGRTHVMKTINVPLSAERELTGTTWDRFDTHITVGDEIEEELDAPEGTPA